jgi:catechol 2,3-dioxygenase-like lactoylglutathione lyase family enzyme
MGRVCDNRGGCDDQDEMVGINISDQQRALDFYTGKLGFEVHTDLPMGGSQRWIELRVPGSDTHVTLFTPAGHEDRFGSFLESAVRHRRCGKDLSKS